MIYQLEVVNIQKLSDEAKAATYKASSLSYDSTTKEVTVHLIANLTAQEQSDLNDVFTNFVDEPESNFEAKIYSYVGGDIRGKDYREIDYRVEILTSIFPKDILFEANSKKWSGIRTNNSRI